MPVSVILSCTHCLIIDSHRYSPKRNGILFFISCFLSKPDEPDHKDHVHYHQYQWDEHEVVVQFSEFFT